MERMGIRNMDMVSMNLSDRMGRGRIDLHMQSLFGEFGGSAFRAAEWMLSNEIAGIVASDAHDAILRTPDMENVIEMLELYYGMDAAEVLTEKTPGWILGDKEFQ